MDNPMRDRAQIRKIAEIVADTLAADFGNARIIDVEVYDDVDVDGDQLLRIEVVFEGRAENIDVRGLTGAVRQVRPKLNAIGENAFPLFSFISERDAGRRRFEPA